MTDRIRLLLETLNLTASQFADEINVQRSGVSHIMSGRNKASLEFIRKILERYPEISPDWLISGKGAMYRHTRKNSEGAESAKQNDIKQESTKGMFDFADAESLHETRENRTQEDTAHKSEVSEENKKETKRQQTVNQVERIIILYDDGSFNDYFPGK